MIHLDLFSGIAGFALAVDEVWPGAEHTFCEIDPYCRALLKLRYPKARIYGDIKELTFVPTYDTLNKKGDYHGVSEKQEIRRGCEDIQQGDVHRGDSEILSGYKASDVENSQETGSCIQKQFTIWDKEPFLQGNKSNSKNSTYNGMGDKKRRVNSTPIMSRMQGDRELKGDRNTPRRLPKTARSDVAVSTMSSQVAQKKYSERIVLNEKIDLLTAGTPCQPASCAGKRRGEADDRWLWPETFRIIREAQPRWVILENVRGILTLESGLVFKSLLAEMEGCGYETRVYIIPACGVNAPHRRDRVWIVANNKSKLQEWPEPEGNSGRQPKASIRNRDWDKPWLEVATRLCGVDARFSDWLDRYFREVIYDEIYETKEMQVLFNAIQSPEIRQAIGGLYKVDEAEILLETVCQFQKRARKPERLHMASKAIPKKQMRTLPEYEWIRCSSQRREHNKQLAKQLVDIVQELSYETALEVVETGLILWGAYSAVYSNAVELDGLKLSKSRHRIERLKSLGNAIVPAVAVEIMKAIKITERLPE